VPGDPELVPGAPEVAVAPGAPEVVPGAPDPPELAVPLPLVAVLVVPAPLEHAAIAMYTRHPPAKERPTSRILISSTSGSCDAGEARMDAVSLATEASRSA
jgi:hypothetical protein